MQPTTSSITAKVRNERETTQRQQHHHIKMHQQKSGVRKKSRHIVNDITVWTLRFCCSFKMFHSESESVASAKHARLFFTSNLNNKLRNHNSDIYQSVLQYGFFWMSIVPVFSTLFLSAPVFNDMHCIYTHTPPISGGCDKKYPNTYKSTQSQIYSQR